MSGLDEYLDKSTDEKFAQFMNTRFPTNRTPKYWVNWKKVRENVAEYELYLTTLNYLVGKRDIQEAATFLFTKQPELLKAVPLLLASRESELSVLTMQEGSTDLSYYDLDFGNPDISKLSDYMKFMNDSGILEFISEDVHQSLVDYVSGIEVGLDSNGRKNRSGTMNEDILELNLKRVTQNTGWEYATQATGKMILAKWAIEVPEVLQSGAKGGRRYDGAIFNPERNEVTIIETNYYGGGGSKLKAVSGEFSSIYATSLKNAAHVNFAWISDGLGWDTAKNPMREAFDVIPTIFNLKMVSDGYLHDLVQEGSRREPVTY